MPTDVVGVLLGHRAPVTTAQLLNRLLRGGLVRYTSARLGVLLGSRPVRLWILTAAGRAFLDRRSPMPQVDARQLLAYRETEVWRDPARARDVHMQVACYRLLAHMATALARPVQVGAWEHPWVRTIPATNGQRSRNARLPAAATLLPASPPGRLPVRLLLLPDIGTAPLSGYRRTLQQLLAFRRTVPNDGETEAVLAVGVMTPPSVSGARVHAWRALLEDVARRRGEQPLRASVLALANPSAGRDERDERPGAQVDQLLALIARHPLLTRRQLASLLDTSSKRIARLESELAERGWLRVLNAPGAQFPGNDDLRRPGLVELTPAGRREAVRRLLVPADLARRRHGLLLPEGTRQRFLRHLQHTLGANAFFVHLAVRAGNANSRSASDALVEWRSAAACARGRFRPDGYGCYRRGSCSHSTFGFFLEYDRGTERPIHYAAKLAAYYRYRDSGFSARDYQGFPSVLVVSTADVPEAQFAYQAYLAEQRYGGTPLSIFLTTERRIAAHPNGALGAVWRRPGRAWTIEDAARQSWLPKNSSSRADSWRW
jgi:hypothetical protein